MRRHENVPSVVPAAPLSARNMSQVMATVALALLLVSVIFLTSGCTPELTQKNVELAEVHVYDLETRSTVIMPVELGDAGQLASLKDAWESLRSADHVNHSFGSDYDATLKIQFKDGRTVLIAWRQSWSHLRPDYLERWEYGKKVVPVDAAGASSTQMVELLKRYIAQPGLTPGGT